MKPSQEYSLLEDQANKRQFFSPENIVLQTLAHIVPEKDCLKDPFELPMSALEEQVARDSNIEEYSIITGQPVHNVFYEVVNGLARGNCVVKKEQKYYWKSLLHPSEINY